MHARGVRAEPARAGPAPRVPQLRGARPLRALRRDRRADATQELACAQCATVRPMVCLHCHGSTFRAVRPGMAHAARRPRRAAAAHRGRRRSTPPPTTCPTSPVLVGTEAVLHRVAGPVGLVAYLELDQELLAPRARAAEQALWLLVRGARLLGDGGPPARADPPARARGRAGGASRRTDARRRRRTGPPPGASGSHPSVGWPRSAAPPRRSPPRAPPPPTAGVTVLGPVDAGTGARALAARPDGRRPVRRARGARRRRRPRPRAAADRRRSPSGVTASG